MNSSFGVSAESRQEERRKLKEMANRDDMFDQWVRLVLLRAPPIYVFVNITLLIWIAQSIFNSSLDTAPKSIYLIAPLLTLGPINRIVPLQTGSDCPEGTQMLSLKTSPTIHVPNIPHQIMTTWGDSGVQFCVDRIKLHHRLKRTCPQDQFPCSGYCVKHRQQCPITGIRTLPHGVGPKPDEVKFMTLDNKDYYYNRDENPPIVSIMAAFKTKCANDAHYTQVYEKQSDYWAAVINCGSEGTINSFYNKFDEMNTNTFLDNNKVHMVVTSPILTRVSLGTVQEFILSDSANEGCQDAKKRSQKIQPYLQRGPMGPQFTQSLLIIAFILLIAEICWLVAYYCFDGLVKEKNGFVVLISIVEVVIISFIYGQNQQLFYIQQLSKTLAKCLKQSLPAMAHWHFGLDSPAAFKMIQFINIAFLALYIVVYLLNYYIFKQFRRRPHGGQINED